MFFCRVRRFAKVWVTSARGGQRLPDLPPGPVHVHHKPNVKGMQNTTALVLDGTVSHSPIISAIADDPHQQPVKPRFCFFLKPHQLFLILT